jgi:phosphoenolpyruvate carboxykinase (ATP)
MVTAALTGQLNNVDTVADPVFGLGIPVRVPGVPDDVLQPRNTWPKPAQYDEQAKKLADMFRENFKRFAPEVSEAVRAAGP